METLRNFNSMQESKRQKVSSSSPNFNPIENVFNHVKSEVRTQAFEKNINYENTPTEYIDKTIESIPKRMLVVIKSIGKRAKY